MAEPDDDTPGVPEWVVTYGDMMSLLLTFFIMLVSMSELKTEKGSMRAMLESIRKTFGRVVGDVGAPGSSTQKFSMLSQLSSAGSRSDGGRKKFAIKAPQGPRGPKAGVKKLNHGTRITLGGPAYFESFDASPSESLRENLDIVARVLAKKPNQLMVRGHATREPLPADANLEFSGIPVRDQWDLSFARALAVADYLEKKGIDRRRLVVSAAGSTEPRKPTRQKDVRKVNRRVDVFLLDSYISPSR